MTNDEIMALPGDNNPVLLQDGQMGMLLIYPSIGGLCGVQVPGEEEHRWMSAADLSAGQGGALRQAGAPDAPSDWSLRSPQQMLIAMDWEHRGGC